MEERIQVRTIRVTVEIDYDWPLAGPSLIETEQYVADTLKAHFGRDRVRFNKWEWLGVKKKKEDK